MVDQVQGGVAGEHPAACPFFRLTRRATTTGPSAARQAPLSKRIKEIAETRVRYGYRRIHVLLRREGWSVNVKRVSRLYREKGCNCAQAAAPARQAKLREAIAATLPRTRSGRWTSCMISCSMAGVRGSHRRRHVEPSLSGDARLSISDSLEVIDALEQRARANGLPKTIRVDKVRPIRPRTSICGRSCERRHARLLTPRQADRQRLRGNLDATVRLECLGRYWFLDLDDACQKVEEWRTEYNEVRPHSAIGDRTPLSLIHLPRQQAEALNRPGDSHLNRTNFSGCAQAARPAQIWQV